MSAFHCASVIVRGVADSMGDDALRMDPNAPVVAMETARKQHENYVSVFKDKLGLNVIEVEAEHSLPDCVFVEDPLVVVGRKALITKPGHPSRRAECPGMLDAVKTFQDLQIFEMEKLDPNATLDGGDVLFTGEELLVGVSSRTNQEGVAVLSQVFSPIPVTSVEVSDSLHLKSVCSMASPGVIMTSVGSEAAKTIVKRLKSRVIKKYKFLEVDGPSTGANCVYLETARGSALLYPSSDIYPATKEAYESIDVTMKFPMDSSEFAKVDGCLTCSSVLLSVTS